LEGLNIDKYIDTIFTAEEIRIYEATWAILYRIS
jgi:hypothetical protein